MDEKRRWLRMPDWYNNWPSPFIVLLPLVPIQGSVKLHKIVAPNAKFEPDKNVVPTP